MTNTQNSLEVRACIDGTCTEFSESVLIFFGDDITSCRPLLELKDYRFWELRRNGGIDLEMILKSGKPEYQILLDWGDATIENSTLYRDKNTSYHHVYKDIGQYNGSLSTEDSQGCKGTYYFSVAVTKDFRQVPWLIVLIIATLISPVAALACYIRDQKEENETLSQTVNRMLSRRSGNSPGTKPTSPEQ